MAESAAIRIDFTPCREYQFTHTTRGPCDSCTPLRAHKGVPVTTFPKCSLTSCQGPVSAETPRVPPGYPRGSLTHAQLNRSPPHIHTHTTGEREQRVRD